MSNLTSNPASVKRPNILVLETTFPYDLSVGIQRVVFVDTDRIAYRCGKLIFALYSAALRYAEARRAKLARLPRPVEDTEASAFRSAAFRICQAGYARSLAKGYGR